MGCEREEMSRRAGACGASVGRLGRLGRAALPVLVPLVLGALVLAVAVPTVRILSLDYRTLMDSLRATTSVVGSGCRESVVQVEYEPRPAGTEMGTGLTFDLETEDCGDVEFGYLIFHDTWVAWGDRALRYGALPLLALLLVELFLRLRARRVAGARSLRDASPSRRAALAGVTLVPFIFFAVPFALALSVWLVVEAFAWLQWFDSITDITAVVLWWAGPTLAGGTMLAGAGLVYLTLGRRPARVRRGRWTRAVRRTFGGLALALIALALFVLGGGILHHWFSLLPVLGSEVSFERHCSECHTPTAPLAYVRTPDQWRSSLEATCFPLMEVQAGDKEEIVRFLAAMRSFSDAWVFRTRCQRCHVTSVLTWEDRHPEDWDMIVQRLARYSPAYYDAPARAQIVRHLSRVAGAASENGPQDAGAATGRILRACTSCHFFSRNRDVFHDVSESEAKALVRRMNGKMARPLSESEVREAARMWRAAARDPELLDRLVPHDRPVMEGGPPW